MQELYDLTSGVQSVTQGFSGLKSLPGSAVEKLRLAVVPFRGKEEQELVRQMVDRLLSGALIEKGRSQ